MKTIVILYAGSQSSHLFDAAFSGKSAFERSLTWAHAVKDCSGITVFADTHTEKNCRTALAAYGMQADIVSEESWTVQLLFRRIEECCKKAGADAAVYAWADCPFLSMPLTAELLRSHTEYAAEYTFADGYPYGFAPEIIDSGSCALLSTLSMKMAGMPGEKSLERDSIFATMKGDINSFEIETVISKKDWRMYRFAFACGSRDGLDACLALYSAAPENTDCMSENAEALAAAASMMPDVLRTVPGFYNVQIEGSCTGACICCPYPAACRKNAALRTRMSAEKFRSLVPQMAALSEKAVVALSAWGEPLNHPELKDCIAAVLAEPGLSVMLETDGLAVTDELAASLQQAGAGRIVWIVSFDAVTPQTYGTVRGCSGGECAALFAKALNAVAVLEKYFPGDVYPQMVRISENEDELEKFYRFWSNAESPSKGKLIIQKYDDFCGLLKSDKPADLAPLERYPCWHIRRDMTILADGTVPVCREYLDGGSANVFMDGVDGAWKKGAQYMVQQIKKEYPEKCRVCDEYYTFNF